MVTVNCKSRNYTMFETKYNFDKLTVVQQTLYSRLLSSRTTAEGRLCNITNIACCSHKLWFHKTISVSKHLTSQAETWKNIRKRNGCVLVSFAPIKQFITSAMFKDEKNKNTSTVRFRRLYNAVCTFWFPVLLHFHSNRQGNHGTNKLGVEVNLPYVI